MTRTAAVISPMRLGSRLTCRRAALTLLGSAAGGVDLELVASPGYDAPAVTLLPVTAASDGTFDGTVATVRVAETVAGAQFDAVIDWGDGTHDTVPVSGSGTDRSVNAGHTFARSGERTKIRVELKDRWSD
jgi:hypothetical protein